MELDYEQFNQTAISVCAASGRIDLEDTVMLSKRMFQRGFTLVELMIVVSIIGILAAGAVPAYSRYIRRSRTVEATMNIRKLFDATVAYYLTERADNNGAILPKSFPGTIPWTPILSGCCLQKGNKCNPATLSADGLCEDPMCFGANAWQQLNFGIDDPFYYSYATTGSGASLPAGKTPGDHYRLQASADLDCDFNNWSLFQRSILVDSNYALKGGSGVFSQGNIN